jgi:hypothetical protein
MNIPVEKILNEIKITKNIQKPTISLEQHICKGCKN